MAPPRLAPGTLGCDASGDQCRTFTRTTPRRPVSRIHTGAWWLGHHLDRDERGEWRDESGFGASRRATRAAGGPRRIRGNTRAARREDLRLAQHAQDLRAEAAGLGGREETAAFYGDQRYAGADRSERRIRSSATEAAESAYEAEQAQRYGGRRRATAAQRRRYEQRRRVTRV